MSPPLAAVTGAFSYTGRSIAERLLATGHPVRTLVRGVPAVHPLRDRVDARVVHLEDEAGLRRALDGVDVLYNTYWVRYERGATTFATAINNSERLFRAARDSGVRRIVQISVTGADPASPVPYYRAKGVLEERLHASGVPHSIVRPTLLFGPNDVLVNNLAWFLRRVPVFGIFGSGRYRLQPVHVDDVARLCVDDVGPLEESVTVDAAGPERYAFREFVRLIRDAVHSRALLVPMPPPVALGVSRLAGLALRDVVLTRDEVSALMGELLLSDTATGSTNLRAWLAEHGPNLGHHYVNDLHRHFPNRRTSAAGV